MLSLLQLIGLLQIQEAFILALIFAFVICKPEFNTLPLEFLLDIVYCNFVDGYLIIFYFVLFPKILIKIALWHVLTDSLLFIIIDLAVDAVCKVRALARHQALR